MEMVAWLSGAVVELSTVGKTRKASRSCLRNGQDVGTWVKDKSDCQVVTGIAPQVRAINLRVLGKPRALSLILGLDKAFSCSKSDII